MQARIVIDRERLIELPPDRNDYLFRMFFEGYKGIVTSGLDWEANRFFVEFEGPSEEVNPAITRFMNWLKFGLLPQGEFHV